MHYRKGTDLSVKHWNSGISTAIIELCDLMKTADSLTSSAMCTEIRLYPSLCLL